MRVRRRAMLVGVFAAVSLAAGACATGGGGGGGVGEPPPNQPPTAVITGGPFAGPEDLHVDFIGTASLDDGDIVGFAWNFGDGATATGPTAQHDYAEGEYTATLLVTDDGGLTDLATVSIHVTDTPIDADHDGHSPEPVGDDCDDDDGAVHPGAPDAFGDGVDQDCDGADGIAGQATFVRAGGSSNASTCGTEADPCDQISLGISRAQSTGRPNVVVAGGTYTSFLVANGINVQGGYDQNFVRNGPTGDKVAEVTAADNGGNWFAIGAPSITTPTKILDLKVTPANAPPGKVSYGVLVTGSTSAALELTSLKISGGKGGNGTAGSSGSAGIAGSPGTKGANSQAGAFTAAECNRAPAGSAGSGSGTGGAGGIGGQGGQADQLALGICVYAEATAGTAGATAPSGGGAGGGGGAARNADCMGTGIGPGVGGNGTAGASGADANSGGGGTASNGTTIGGLWVPLPTGNGGSGNPGLADGKGGGGGGGGGGCNDGAVNDDDRGAGGGGGGQGGTRSTSFGTGGTAGSAWIGILITGGANPTLTAINITIGTGGTGGAGGNGGLGGAGGAGGAGGIGAGAPPGATGAGHGCDMWTGGNFNTSCTGDSGDWGAAGGKGGDGGKGSNAGGGGGGAGGPAFGIARVGAPPVAGGISSIVGGAGGAGGAAGLHGLNPQAGATGLLAGTIQF